MLAPRVTRQPGAPRQFLPEKMVMAAQTEPIQLVHHKALEQLQEVQRKLTQLQVQVPTI